MSIGRALRLVMMNVGLSYPGITDMDTIGTPMKFSCCVAENEDHTPWDPWRVQKGFGLDDSTVTVNVPYGMTEFFDFKNSDPELLIETWSTLTSQACGTPAAGAWLIKKNAPLAAGYPFHGTFSNLLLMAPDHAAVFDKAGWAPDEIQQAIHRATKLPFRQVMLNQDTRRSWRRTPSCCGCSTRRRRWSPSTRRPSASSSSWSARRPDAASSASAAPTR